MKLVIVESPSKTKTIGKYLGNDYKLLFNKYKISVYNGIRILHINLDYLKKKHYTNGKLNEFEKSMLMFVEQDRRKIENKIKRKEVKDIMNFMETLKFKPGDAVT